MKCSILPHCIIRSGPPMREIVLGVESYRGIDRPTAIRYPPNVSGMRPKTMGFVSIHFLRRGPTLLSTSVNPHRTSRTWNQLENPFYPVKSARVLSLGHAGNTSRLIVLCMLWLCHVSDTSSSSSGSAPLGTVRWQIRSELAVVNGRQPLGKDKNAEAMREGRRTNQKGEQFILQFISYYHKATRYFDRLEAAALWCMHLLVLMWSSVMPLHAQSFLG
jgi:hypothetical protein